ncbi:amidotransferase [Flavobacterium rivuli WB 3.3-2 = DSM 21788]|uniref:Amidotransferase n=1 Tax=Flavobacterium rivuli WB 3.3-2 = DSM 21788 TaxID=1121895 RepID=A0A0A2M1E0_9FLAO|nr:type 1 glutamine amidotransferase [Flavobacterium rivuli]KGO85263.1 amidotransferase [Flavobacterium rivuli WB 3.3-2 = DSM 21788]
MNIHIIQHVAFEGPGLLENWFKKNGHIVTVSKMFNAGIVLPHVDNVDGLIILGGPMNVYDDDIYGWLYDEKIFIKNCINANKKILGICLGAQLLAMCLGAKVQKAVHKEIGWFTVNTTDACAKEPFFFNLFNNHPQVFHWHGDSFSIPHGAVNLITSQANNNQGFVYGNHFVGLQFHIEITRQGIEELLINGAEDLTEAPFVQSADLIKKKSTNERLAITGSLMDKLLLQLFA